jgi:hypothetical protein
MALRDLLAHLKISVDDKELKEADKGIEGFVEKLKGVAEKLAVAFAVEKIHEFVEGQIEAGAQLKVTAERLGTDTQELQAMQLAAAQAGVSAETLATSLRFLNKHISEAVHGTGDGAKIFKELGITLKNADGSTRSSTDVMGEFADAVAKIPDSARQTEVAMKLLGRGGAALIPLLKEGGESFRKAREQMIELGGGMSKDFVDAAHKAEAANVRLTFAMTGLKSTIATAILPVFEEIVRVGTRVVVNLIDMAKHTGVVKAAFATFFAVVAALNPGIAALALGATLIYAAFDELYVLLQGGDTLIGDALGPDKAEFVDNLRAAIDDLTDAWSTLIGGTDENADAMETFGKTVVIVAEGVAKLVEALADLVDIYQAAGQVIASLAGGNFSRAISAVGGKQDLKAFDQGQAAAQSGVDALQTSQEHAQYASQHPELSAEQIRAARGASRANRAASSQRAEYDRGEFYGPPQAVASARGQQQIVVQAPGHFQRGGRGGAQGPQVHQTNNFHTEVHTSSDKPGDIAAAVGPAVATPVQRASSRALVSVAKP